MPEISKVETLGISGIASQALFTIIIYTTRYYRIARKNLWLENQF